MTKEDLIGRTKNFAISNARLISTLPFNIINKNYSNQLIRCSSSPGANYRAACRAKSSADFINKLKIVEEELDECIYFLDLLKEFNPESKSQIELIQKEGEELLAIIVAAIITTRKRYINQK